MGKDNVSQNISKEDADKLFSLFRKGPNRGGLNYKKHNAKCIRNVRAYTC
jgi:hypothetical protein